MELKDNFKYFNMMILAKYISYPKDSLLSHMFDVLGDKTTKDKLETISLLSKIAETNPDIFNNLCNLITQPPSNPVSKTTDTLPLKQYSKKKTCCAIQ